MKVWEKDSRRELESLGRFVLSDQVLGLGLEDVLGKRDFLLVGDSVSFGESCVLDLCRVLTRMDNFLDRFVL